MNQIQIITTPEGLQSTIDKAVHEALNKFNASQPTTKVGLLSRSDACKYLGLSLPTLDNLVRSRQLSPIRIGRQVKFDEAELVRFSDYKKRG